MELSEAKSKLEMNQIMYNQHQSSDFTNFSHDLRKMQSKNKYSSIKAHDDKSNDMNNQNLKSQSIVYSNYKTKLCYNFSQYGQCPYNNNCTFAHGKNKLRTQLEQLIVSDSNQNQNQRSNQQQNFNNDSDATSSSSCNLLRYKTALCKSFCEFGHCENFDNCSYAHGSHELRLPFTLKEVNNFIPPHPKYKTELCKNYHSFGVCNYDFNCHYIHERDDPLNADSRFHSNLQNNFAYNGENHVQPQKPEINLDTENENKNNQTFKYLRNKGLKPHLKKFATTSTDSEQSCISISNNSSERVNSSISVDSGDLTPVNAYSRASLVKSMLKLAFESPRNSVEIDANNCNTLSDKVSNRADNESKEDIKSDTNQNEPTIVSLEDNEENNTSSSCLEFKKNDFEKNGEKKLKKDKKSSKSDQKSLDSSDTSLNQKAEQTSSQKKKSGKGIMGHINKIKRNF